VSTGGEGARDGVGHRRCWNGGRGGQVVLNGLRDFSYIKYGTRVRQMSGCEQSEKDAK
jgi:hypothetical protein